ncbi:LysE family translocator, partial [Planctomycetota bacterium]
MIVFIKGILIGFLIALPVGPVAVLCIQRTLTQGRRHGLVSGLGAATADACYGAVAAFGLAYTAHFIEQQSTWFCLLGGLALCLIGFRTFLIKIPNIPTPSGRIAHAGDFLSTFVLTLLNPMTVLAFAAVFANAGLSTCGPQIALQLIVGVFVGSGLWWLTLSQVAGSFRGMIDHGHMHFINRLAGILII